jgi:DNA cross-link repair 1A protein
MVCVVFGFFKDCTKVTANLLASVLSVKPQYIKALPMNEPVLVEGTTVTLVDANHCPGAACLIFQAPNGKVSLHCGDFRYDAELDDHKYFSQLPMIIDSLFIDTTYCDPKYTFPSQRFVVAKTLEIMEREAINDPRTLIAVGSYTIGKERVYLAAAEKFNCKVFVSTYKVWQRSVWIGRNGTN